MLKRKILAVALSAGVPLAAVTFVACEPRERRGEGQEMEQQQEPFGQAEPRREPGQQVQPGQEEIEPQRGQEQAREGQDVRSIEPVRGQELGRTTVTEGEKTVEAQKRVLESTIVEYDIPTVRVCEEKADLNQMSAEHFAALGVSRDAAQRIVDYREQHGQITSIDQLRSVQGVDDQTLRSLEQQVAVRPQGQQ